MSAYWADPCARSEACAESTPEPSHASLTRSIRALTPKHEPQSSIVQMTRAVSRFCKKVNTTRIEGMKGKDRHWVKVNEISQGKIMGNNN